MSKRDMTKQALYGNASKARRGLMTLDEAESIGLAALGFLAEEPKRIGRFLTTSGIDPGELRVRAGDADLLAALLDHILGDETLLLVFCADKRVEPERVAPARMLLAGEHEGS